MAFLRPPLNTVAYESSVLQGKLLNDRLLKKNICILKVIIAIAKMTFEEFIYHYQFEVSSTPFLSFTFIILINVYYVNACMGTWRTP